jgi:hypothetical protein
MRAMAMNRGRCIVAHDARAADAALRRAIVERLPLIGARSVGF